MKSNILKASLLVAVLGVGAYWYESPYLAMREMKAAVDAKDADAFNDHVDYPKLRESLKGQFSALMADQLGAAGISPDSAEKAGAALGSAIGMMVVNGLVEAMVRPELVMGAMRNGYVQTPGDKPRNEPAPSDSTQDTKSASWTLERKGFDRVIARRLEDNEPAGSAAGFVFERYGFANWKLTEIRMPSKTRQAP